MINKDAPFPQANDFEKVLLVLNVSEPEKLKDYEYMCVYLNDVSERQVDYYISACVYLGLISKDKTFTPVGNRLREQIGLEQIASLAQIVVSDESFGIVYFQQKMLGIELDNSDIVDIMKEYIDFESEAMYIRRASTISSWIKWIVQHEDS